MLRNIGGVYAAVAAAVFNAALPNGALGVATLGVNDCPDIEAVEAVEKAAGVEARLVNAPTHLRKRCRQPVWVGAGASYCDDGCDGVGATCEAIWLVGAVSPGVSICPIFSLALLLARHSSSRNPQSVEGFSGGRGNSARRWLLPSFITAFKSGNW